jgi:hypothetical protein
MYELLEHPNPDDPLVASIVSCGVGRVDVEG